MSAETTTRWWDGVATLPVLVVPLYLLAFVVALAVFLLTVLFSVRLLLDIPPIRSSPAAWSPSWAYGLVSATAGAIVSRTGFSPTVMGLTLTAPATSLPALVTAVSSVRRGAVGLGIGDVVVGNAFDTITVAIADLAYVAGSIYVAVSSNVMFITAVALLMTGVLTAGFVRRDRREIVGIGVESYLIVYLVGGGVVLADVFL